jgi:hypothetical protein
MTDDRAARLKRAETMYVAAFDRLRVEQALLGPEGWLRFTRAEEVVERDQRAGEIGADRAWPMTRRRRFVRAYVMRRLHVRSWKAAVERIRPPEDLSRGDLVGRWLDLNSLRTFAELPAKRAASVPEPPMPEPPPTTQMPAALADETPTTEGPDTTPSSGKCGWALGDPDAPWARGRAWWDRPKW